MLTQPLAKKNEPEAGDGDGEATPLYPMMLESPELRWAFIRKVYSILAVQLLATIVVAVAAASVPQLTRFFVSTIAGLVLFIVIILAAALVLWPLSYYYQRHPLNYLLLGIFTVFFAFALGISCAYISGNVILEAVILTTALVVSLTLYTFWAAKRGQDFQFLVPFLFGVIIVLIVFTIIQIFFPLGKLSEMIYGLLASIVYCAYIIFDTDNLIKRCTYDEYIWASVAIYLDILNLFLELLRVYRAAQR